MGMSHRNQADVRASRLIARKTMNLCYKGDCGSTVLRKVRRPGPCLGLKKGTQRMKTDYHCWCQRTAELSIFGLGNVVLQRTTEYFMSL